MSSEAPSTPVMIDDTIDLRPYFLGLFRFWPLVLGLPLIAVLATFALAALRGPMYEAKVGVAIVSYKTDFSLEPSMTTESDDGEAQRKALVGLATNPGIAQQVIATLGDALPADYRDPGDLTAMVTAEAQQSDLVEITVLADDPDVAVQVARAWAQAYETHINDVFQGVAPTALAAIAEQVEHARGEYEAAEQALIAFTAENRAGELERRVTELETLLTSLLERRTRLERLLGDAEGLLAVVEDGGAGAASSNATALTLLKAQAYASSSLPEGLVLQMAPPADGALSTAQAQAADLRALIAALEDERAQYEGSGQGAGNVSQLEQELSGVKAELEEAQANERELTRARDVAWDTYSALARKIAEQRVESALTRNIVRVASEPLRPTRPAGMGSLQTALLAGVGGLVVAVLISFFITYLAPDYRPAWLRRRRVLPEGGDAPAD